jgi:hypothetical protein
VIRDLDLAGGLMLGGFLMAMVALAFFREARRTRYPHSWLADPNSDCGDLPRDHHNPGERQEDQ